MVRLINKPMPCHCFWSFTMDRTVFPHPSNGNLSRRLGRSGALARRRAAKPFRDQDLLDAIQPGLARDRERRENDTEIRALSERFETLTSREREVMSYVVTGRLNKEIVGDLGQGARRGLGRADTKMLV